MATRTSVYRGVLVRGQPEAWWTVATLSSGAVLVAAGLIILWFLRQPSLGGLTLSLGLLAMVVFLGLRASAVRRHAASTKLLAPLYLVAMGVGLVLGLVTLAASAIVLITGQSIAAVKGVVDVLPFGGIVFIVVLVASVLIDPFES